MSFSLKNNNSASSLLENNADAMVYWPRSLLLTSGYIIGWNVRSFIICVATIVPFGTNIKDYDRILAEILANSDVTFVEHMNKTCAVAPSILGVFHASVNDEKDDYSFSAYNKSSINERKHSASIWFTAETDFSGAPIVRSIYCCGYRYSSLSTQFFFYNPPDPFYLESLSLVPLQLDTSVDEAYFTEPNYKVDTKPPGPCLDSEIKRKLSIHTKFPSVVEKQQNNDLEIIVQQINCVSELKQAIEKKLGIWNNTGRWRNIIDNSFASALKATLQKILKPPLFLILLAIRVISEVLLVFLNKEIFNAPQCHLKNFSFTAQQLDLRLQQFCFWPWQWLVFRRKGWKYQSFNRAHYISFFNSMWLIANDIIIGITIGSFILEHTSILEAEFHEIYRTISIDLVESTIVWLRGWPAGDLFIGLIYVWTYITDPLWPYFPYIVRAVGYSGMFGATMIMSVFLDLVSILNCHLYIFYFIAAKIYHLQLNTLWSLFNLFRGKKFNVLRNRLESCDYDLDQLLLGTILFTVFFFLFPTVAVYYVLFCAARITVIIVQITVRSMLVILNHFPLFTLMLRFKDPLRLHGGIFIKFCSESDFQRRYSITMLIDAFKCFIGSSTPGTNEKLRRRSGETFVFNKTNASFSKSSIRQRKGRQNYSLSLTSTSDENNVSAHGHASSEPSTPVSQYSMLPNLGTYMTIHNVPIPFSSIFFQYSLLSKRLVSHFFSFEVLKSMILGKPIKANIQLEYPMLPSSRPSIWTFWTVLTSKSGN